MLLASTRQVLRRECSKSWHALLPSPAVRRHVVSLSSTAAGSTIGTTTQHDADRVLFYCRASRRLAGCYFKGCHCREISPLALMQQFDAL